jgi:hypothetical protein
MVKERDADIAALNKSVKESQEKFEDAKKDLEKQIALIR